MLVLASEQEDATALEEDGMDGAKIRGTHQSWKEKETAKEKEPANRGRLTQPLPMCKPVAMLGHHGSKCIRGRR
jgi:hypothetical protein